MGDFMNAPRGAGGRGGRSFQAGGRWNHHGSGVGRGRGRGRRFHNSGPGRRNGGRSQYHNITDDRIEILGKPSPTSLNIAIEGCCHGELDSIYERLQAHENHSGQKVDLLVCCGDFQSFRNLSDFHSCSMPHKYRRLGSFPKYYSMEKKAPILTLFIGGNHEASQPLRELYYGGWVAPNIYYLGAAGVVKYGGIRIGGISGIYKSHDYELGHHEQPPFDNKTLRSVYHVRNVDIYRMKCLSKGTSRVDIIATHDWPLGIEQHGNTKELVRKKPYFSAEIQRNELGSLPNRQVLDTVQPKWWFSAHLHVKFTATVDHDATKKITGDVATAKAPLIPSQVKTKVAIVGDTSIPGRYPGGRDAEDAISKVDPVESSMGAAVTKETNFHALQSSCDTISDLTAQMTHFLALDKCLPRRHYLSILHMECGSSKNDACLEYDLEWLAILRKTHNLNSDERRNVKVPETLADILSDDIQWIEDRLKAMNSDGEGNDLDFCLRIPRNFQPTVPFYSDPCFQSPTVAQLLPKMGNPQTDFILELLELDHCVTVPFDTTLTPSKLSAILRCYDKTRIPVGPDENEIKIENDEISDMETETKEIPVIDENEIQIDDEDEDESNTTPSESVNCTEVTKEKASAKKARLEQ